MSLAKSTFDVMPKKLSRRPLNGVSIANLGNITIVVLIRCLEISKARKWKLRMSKQRTKGDDRIV
jgi:hypothetical protein